jgi:hypothetical protein
MRRSWARKTTRLPAPERQTSRVVFGRAFTVWHGLPCRGAWGELPGEPMGGVDAHLAVIGHGARSIARSILSLVGCRPQRPPGPGAACSCRPEVGRRSRGAAYVRSLFDGQPPVLVAGARLSLSPLPRSARPAWARPPLRRVSLRSPGLGLVQIVIVPLQGWQGRLWCGPGGAGSPRPGRCRWTGYELNLDGIGAAIPWARTAPVPAMWFSAMSRAALAEGFPATIALMAASRVETWPFRSAATAEAGSLVAPAMNWLNWVV